MHYNYLIVFQCLLLHVNIAHANMLVIYLFLLSIFYIFLYFCVKGNLQIRNFIAWCKLCVYDNETS